jgi:hypothetical protein
VRRFDLWLGLVQAREEMFQSLAQHLRAKEKVQLTRPRRTRSYSPKARKDLTKSAPFSQLEVVQATDERGEMEMNGSHYNVKEIHQRRTAVKLWI